jgi:hypothetical protein
MLFRFLKSNCKQIFCKQIFIVKVAFPGYAQWKSITGKVTDAVTGEALIGAQVTVAGATRGIATDISGEFSLEVTSDEILTITYLGYVSQKVSVGNNTRFEIRMQTSMTDLDEVIVTGYTTQKKATLTGAVVQIKNEEIVLTKNENVVNMMSAKLPGVRVWQRSAEPENLIFIIRITMDGKVFCIYPTT